MKEIIIKYLEEQIIEDSALKEKYDPAKIDKCISYITAQAKKMAKGKGSIAVEDVKVFKWARDYYLENPEIDEEADEFLPENPSRPEPHYKKPKKEKKPEFVEVNGIKYDREGNGCLFDF